MATGTQSGSIQRGPTNRSIPPITAALVSNPEQCEALLSHACNQMANAGAGTRPDVKGAVQELAQVTPSLFGSELATPAPESFVEKVDTRALNAAIAANESSGVEKLAYLSEVAILSAISGFSEVLQGDLSNLKRWLPDGYGVTIQLRDDHEPHSFRTGLEAEAFIKTLPDNSIRDIEFYGHGAPGMMSLEDGYLLDAHQVSRMLSGKMMPNGAIHLIGCNTASIGEDGIEGINVPGAVATAWQP